jgi:hypothetical protein
VRAAGVEPTTCGFGGRHSIQLSYARTQVHLRLLCGVQASLARKTRSERKSKALARRYFFPSISLAMATTWSGSNPNFF